MTVTVIGSQTGQIYDYKDSVKGTKPYIDPLPYVRSRFVVTSGYNSTYCRAGDGWPTVAHPTLLDTKLYAKFESEVKAGSQAMIGVTIAESQQAWEMMSGRLTQIAGFLGLAIKEDEWDFRRLRLRKQAAGIKKMTKAQKRRFLAKTALDANSVRYGIKTGAAWWLEFWLGWSALINDLYNGYQFLNTFAGIETATAKTGFDWEQIRGRYPTGSFPPSATGMLRTHVKVKSRVRHSARVKISNPDTYALYALGLTNPALIAAELVSKSFVLNWFATLNEFMSQFDARLGFSLTGGHYTTYRTCSTTVWYRTAVGEPFKTGTIDGFTVVRTLQDWPPGPSLELRDFKGFSPTRGATASALVLQYLKRVPN